MTILLDDTPVFDAVRSLKREWLRTPAVGLTAAEFAQVKAAIEAMDAADRVEFGPAPNTLPVPVLVPADGRLTVEGLQRRLGVKEDGKFLTASRGALRTVLTNTNAPALTTADFQRVADRWRVPVKHIIGVRKVEAPRGAFDVTGIPTHLYERHVANRNTVPVGRYAKSHPGLFSPAGYGSGGYGAYSAQFDRLADACGLDPEAAFRACSWGAFQVLGENAVALGYSSAFDMALTLATGEAAHLDSFVRYVEVNDLVDKFRLIEPGVPESAVPFVSVYNGPGHARFNYAPKLVEAVK